MGSETEAETQQDEGHDSGTESLQVEPMPVRDMSIELERLAGEVEVEGDDEAPVAPAVALPQRANGRRARATSRGADGVPHRFAAVQAATRWSEQA